MRGPAWPPRPSPNAPAVDAQSVGEGAAPAASTCPCRHAPDPFAPFAWEALRAVARANGPADRARLQVDRVSLRAALGEDGALVEELGAKATGRPGADAAVMWRYFTTSVYQSGDLPVLATREALQNSVDAIKAAVRARQLRAGEGRFSVRWDPDRRALSWEDNGIGMDADTILTKFLSLGASGKADAGDSGEAAGGFGVAKAVILGTSPTFRWELHSRDNLAVSAGSGQDVQVYDAPHRQGTRITIFDLPADVDEHWDYARQDWVPLVTRLRELLGANDLPGLRLELDGAEVEPLFSRRGGSRVRVEGSWGRGAEASVKAYRRAPGDRHGAYYVRLGGLFQFQESARRGALKADVVIDLTTTVRPGQAGYPLNAARDALQDSARWAFSDLVDEVERESESSAREQEDEVYEPESDDPDARAGAEALAELAAEAFADPELQRALAEAAGGIADHYAAQAADPGVRRATESKASPGTRAPAPGEGPSRGPVLPAGILGAAAGEAAGPAAALRLVLEGAELARGSAGAGAGLGGGAADTRGTLGGPGAGLGNGGDPTGGGVLDAVVRAALDDAAAGRLDDNGAQVLAAAVDRAAEAALGPGGGGLLAVARGEAALQALTPAGGAPQRRRNPFGALAGLRISRKGYDRRRAARFKKGFARWLPHLTAWDATLRLVAAEAQLRRRFKPGFVLDDEVIGLTATSGESRAVIYLHPDRFAQVISAHRERPLAIAAFLHGVACHELTHLDGRMGQGHSEAFVVAREDLGHATAHLLPAIAVLVQKVLGLPVKPSAEAKRIGQLERQLARLKERAGEGRQAEAEVGRLRAEIDALRADLADARAESARVRELSAGRCRGCRCGGWEAEAEPRDRAEETVEMALDALMASPPPRVSADEVRAFGRRQWEGLVGVVRGAMTPHQS